MSPTRFRVNPHSIVRLRTKCLWVRVQLQSLKLRFCTCFVQRIPSDSRNYKVWIHSEKGTWHDKNMQWKDNHSQHSLIIWPVWLIGWVFNYELSGCGFKPSSSHLNFRFLTCFEQGVSWHSGNYRLWIHSETRTWHDQNIESLGGHIQNISKTVFPKLIFYKRFINELPDVLFQEFYIHSTYVIYHCI